VDPRTEPGALRAASPRRAAALRRMTPLPEGLELLPRRADCRHVPRVARFRQTPAARSRASRAWRRGRATFVDGTMRARMLFIPSMLCNTLPNPSRIGDPRYVAEPKFDGQRASSTSRKAGLQPPSRTGRSLLTYPGLAPLRDGRWPIDEAVLDGDAP
jgi:ATP-dependent DNA ligase